MQNRFKKIETHKQKSSQIDCLYRRILIHVMSGQADINNFSEIKIKENMET